MASPKALKDKFFEKVINPYIAGVLQQPQSIDMREWVLHIRDVDGPKKTGSMEARLEAMEQQVIKCQGMVERGLNANHMMITEFTNKHKIDANHIGKHLSRLYDRIDHLQAQIYDLQNQNCAHAVRIPKGDACGGGSDRIGAHFIIGMGEMIPDLSREVLHLLDSSAMYGAVSVGALGAAAMYGRERNGGTNDMGEHMKAAR
ncbi:40S ribosomal protein S5-1 [Hordeum vulgare]|nr:40S ribosomal protein S5-1 [Hordeum vulgare]